MQLHPFYIYIIFIEMSEQCELISIFFLKNFIWIWFNILFREKFIWCDDNTWYDKYNWKALERIDINLLFVSIQIDLYYYWKCSKEKRTLFKINK